MPLKLLQHKSWHVYSQENIARVKRDEARAAAQDAEDDERTLLADSEARLDRMRKTVEGKKRKRDRDDEGEKALDRQLKGKGNGREEEREQDVRAVIVRPAGHDAQVKDKGKGKGKEKDVPMTTNGHLNFWAELEDGGQAGSSKLESRLKKVLAAEPDDSLTKVYLAKKGEGEPVGWYASQDGKTERERKETIETTLERTYRDTESKRFSDPLALMNSYLQRRDDVLSGKALPARSRSGVGAASSRWDDTPRSTLSSSTAAAPEPFEPVLPSLLPRKHERRRARSPPREAPPPPAPTARHATDPAREAAARVSSERTRAAALLAARRKAALSSGSTAASSTPGASGSEAGGGAGWGVYNREAVEAAREARRGYAGERSGGGGWAERKGRREERERERRGGAGWERR